MLPKTNKSRANNKFIALPPCPQGHTRAIALPSARRRNTYWRRAHYKRKYVFVGNTPRLEDLRGCAFVGKEEKMATIDDFRKLELRIAQIKEVNDHPNADKLLILTLDLGDRQKQVVAGIKNFYSKEELIGKQVVLVDNLDPVILRGVESQGMILAGSDENILAVISPEKKLKLGSIVK